ncbi:MAG TPA: hypothetical protein VGD72_10145 [Mycobacteriales bacterium]
MQTVPRQERRALPAAHESTVDFLPAAQVDPARRGEEHPLEDAA